jgi:hypothetical protein
MKRDNIKEDPIQHVSLFLAQYDQNASENIAESATKIMDFPLCI